MKNKEKLKKSLASAKVVIEQKKVDDDKKQKQEQELANEITKNFQNKGEKKMKKLNKKIKSDLALLKMFAQMEATHDKTKSITAEFEALVKEYSDEQVETKALTEEKAIALTSDHTNLLREIQSSDIQFSFDAKSEAGKVLALFNRWDMPVVGKVKIPVGVNSVELQHVSETGAVGEQDTTETLLNLEVTRAALSFKFSRTLQFKSIVDKLALMESIINMAVEKGLVEGIINGQGSSPQVDNGYASIKMGTKMAGIRAKLAAQGYVKDMSNAALTGDSGRTAMQSVFDAAGAPFSRSQDGYVILAARPEKLLLSALKKGSGVTGVNPASGEKVYEDSYLGIPVIETGFLISRTASSGSGYDETGFVSATAANNDHGAFILLNPKAVWYSVEGERVDVEYKPSTDSYEVTLNCQAGWNMLCDSNNQPGVYAINIGADI